MKKLQAIILGAGRPYKGDNSASLHRLGETGRVLDWLIAAFKSVQADVTFVGGYRFESVTASYPNLRYLYNPQWQSTGSAASLFLAAPPLVAPCFACYGDLVFRDELLQKMVTVPQTHMVIAIDTSKDSFCRETPREQVVQKEGKPHFLYDARPLGDAFVGVVLFSPEALAAIATLSHAEQELLHKKHLGQLCAVLVQKGFSFSTVNATGLWTSMDDESSLARFVFGTKAETMERLQGCLPQGMIPRQVRFSAKAWKKDPATVLENIVSGLDNRPMAIRSSALSEDGFYASKAGQFSSFLSVPPEKTHLQAAITDVFDSYGPWDDKNQVLVQNMLENIALSGVAFSRSLEGRAPYYVVNYSEGEDTTQVTSGKAEQHSVVVLRGYGRLPAKAPLSLAPLLPLLEQLESLTGYSGLDVEFAIDTSSTLFILQVRPLTVPFLCSSDEENLIKQELDAARQQFISLTHPAPPLVGNRTIWGVMPDWNPAEMLGLKPGALAASLYRYVIVDEVWASLRAKFGYRDVRPQPLMRLFAGQPYIDVRASLNSFVPASVDASLAQRMVEAALDRLEEEPALHDKLEFALIPTCMDFHFDYWQEQLIERAGLSEKEFEILRHAYAAITASAPTLCRQAQELLPVLEQRRSQIVASQLPLPDKVMHLLDDCKRYGTLPFALLARCGFIAASLLRTLPERGVLTPERVDELKQSIKTVSHDFQQDLHLVKTGSLTLDDFLGQYGHLRPGTYDIASPSYQDKPDAYLMNLLHHDASLPQIVPFAFSAPEQNALNHALVSIGFPGDATSFLDFVRQAIAGREYAKFLFTRNISISLDYIVSIGQELGLAREDMAHLDIAHLATARTSPGKAACEILKQCTLTAKEQHAFQKWIVLPPLLLEENDFFSFQYPQTRGNFITSLSITAPVQEVLHPDAADLRGKIALIPQADPGYDWLFGHQLAGLVTMFGGANSHMAIRAAEHNLPAAIGVGEVCYRALGKASLVLLDCKGQRVLPVQAFNKGKQ